MLESAEARPPLSEVEAACRGPLDALEQAHGRARDLLEQPRRRAGRRPRPARRPGRPRPVGGRLRADARQAAAERQLAGEELEADPVAARGRLEDASLGLTEMTDLVEAVEAADDRRHLAGERVAAIRGHVAARRGDGLAVGGAGRRSPRGCWPLPRPRPTRQPNRSIPPTWRLPPVISNRPRPPPLRPPRCWKTPSPPGQSRRGTRGCGGRPTRLELTAALPTAAEHLAHLQARYAEAGLGRSRRQSAPRLAGRASGARRCSSGGRAEEAARSAAFLPGRGDPRGSRATGRLGFRLPGGGGRSTAGTRRTLGGAAGIAGRSGRRVADLAATLARQRTDRARANERCREAERLLELAADWRRPARPDPRQIAQACGPPETAAGPGRGVGRRGRPAGRPRRPPT